MKWESGHCVAYAPSLGVPDIVVSPCCLALVHPPVIGQNFGNREDGRNYKSTNSHQRHPIPSYPHSQPDEIGTVPSTGNFIYTNARYESLHARQLIRATVGPSAKGADDKCSSFLSVCHRDSRSVLILGGGNKAGQRR